MTIRRASTVVALASLLTSLSACALQDGTTAFIQIAPAAADIAPGESVAFVAEVDGVPEAAEWTVVEPDGGVIDAEGLYTAPETEGTFTVLASVPSHSVTESTRVQVRRGVRVQVSPTTTAVAAGGSVAFSASVQGTSVTTVSWSIAEAPVGGSVTAAGLYTAPETPGTYRVVATSTADPTRSGTATVSVTATAPPPTTGPAVAFQGAQGAGAVAVGGRGGAVHLVTTLADSGTGSLRACVAASGPRTCVFRVAGNIRLTAPLIIKNPYLTIAGQTAPGGGVAIDGRSLAEGMIGLYTHDVVIRYVRFRKGYNAGTPYGKGTVFGIYQGVYNTVLDHCSFSWGEDDLLSVWTASGTPSRNITFSWNMLYEPYSVHPTAMINGSNTNALSDGMTNLDYHHNLIANFGWRAPLWKAKSGRIVNNVIYNRSSWATRIGGGASVDIVSNKWVVGALSNPGHEITAFPGGNAQTPTGAPSLYVAGNLGPNNPSDPGADNWTSTSNRSMVWQCSAESGSETGALATSYRRSTPLPAAGVAITAVPATQLDATLLATVGASRRLDCDGRWVDMRDAADARTITHYTNRTGGIPAHNATSVTWPSLAAGTPCADSDRDGMPDVWETARGLNPLDARDGPALQANGYTNLEHYLNGM